MFGQICKPELYRALTRKQGIPTPPGREGNRGHLNSSDYDRVTELPERHRNVQPAAGTCSSTLFSYVGEGQNERAARRSGFFAQEDLLGES